MQQKTETPLMKELQKYETRWFAKEVGVKPAAVWKWKKGQRVPSEPYRRKIAEITGKGIFDLFYGEGSDGQTKNSA